MIKLKSLLSESVSNTVNDFYKASEEAINVFPTLYFDKATKTAKGEPVVQYSSTKGDFEMRPVGKGKLVVLEIPRNYSAKRTKEYRYPVDIEFTKDNIANALDNLHYKRLGDWKVTNKKWRA